MLVKNAQNLMQAVVKTLKAAEAACVKVILRLACIRAENVSLKKTNTSLSL